MTTFQPLRLVLATATALAALLIAVQEAKSHGDAAWIQEGGYVDQEGVHCCGPSDCARHPAQLVRIGSNGIYVKLSADADEQFVPRSALRHGIYPSIDGDVWVCARGGIVKCVFPVPTGM